MSRNEKLFIFFAILTNFCIGGEYAITRPASQSLFIGTFSTSALPAFWLATIPLNLLVVSLYNRFLSRLGPLKMMGVITSSVALINFLCAFLLPLYPELVFFQYCWKDIYILLMFKQLWSMIHSTLPQKYSKTFFGIIFGGSTAAACLGSLVPGFYASKFGTESLFLCTPCIYAVLFLFYFLAYRCSSVGEVKMEEQNPTMREAFSLISKNRILVAILLFGVCMQVSVAFVEYQFNHHLEIAFPVKDLRTECYGKIFSILQAVSFLFQTVGSFIVLNFLSVKRSHLLIPILLLLTAAGQLAIPGFAMIATAFILTKSMDFSLFGIVREILFSPLKVDEKFRAKAVIDVFASRTSKSIASFLLWGLQFWVGAKVFAFTTYLSLAILGVWILVVAWFFKIGKDPVYLKV